jgi:hypothetical protein
MLLNEAFIYGDGAESLCYVGTNAEPLYLGFFNFVQCHIFVGAGLAQAV